MSEDPSFDGPGQHIALMLLRRAINWHKAKVVEYESILKIAEKIELQSSAEIALLQLLEDSSLGSQV